MGENLIGAQDLERGMCQTMTDCLSADGGG